MAENSKCITILKKMFLVDIRSSFQKLTTSRCKPYDNNELDVFSFVKFISFFGGTMCWTAFLL